MSSAAEGSERREGRWRRFLTKLRDVVKRSTISSTAPSKATSHEPMADPQPLHPSAAGDRLDTTSAHSNRVADLQPSCASVTIITTPLISDNSIHTDETPKVSLPMPSTFTAISNRRAQCLFEKYGIPYEPRIVSKESELTYDIRRVEKPIRMRLRYDCEECGTGFGRDRICVQCGHRRCLACPRNPPRRVREVLNETRQQQQERAQERMQEASTDQYQSTNSPMAVRTIDTDMAPHSATSHAIPTEQEVEALDETADSTQYQYVTQDHPCGTLSLPRTRVQLDRYTCHECETHFGLANRPECQTCGHIRCNLCPYETPGSTAQQAPADEYQQTAPVRVMTTANQRVYRRPRQRIRWTCDQCQTMFLNRDRCQECGHDRCGQCIRSPARRIPRPPDPEILQAVDDKLEDFLGEQSSSSQPAASNAA